MKQMIKTGWSEFDSIFPGFEYWRAYCIAAPKCAMMHEFAVSLAESINAHSSSKAIVTTPFLSAEALSATITAQDADMVLVSAENDTMFMNDEVNVAKLSDYVKVARQHEVAIVFTCVLEWDDLEWDDVRRENYYTLSVDMPYYDRIAPFVSDYLILDNGKKIYEYKDEMLTGYTRKNVLYMQGRTFEQDSIALYFSENERRFIDSSEFRAVLASSKIASLSGDEGTSPLKELIGGLGLEGTSYSHKSYDFFHDTSRGSDEPDENGAYYSIDRKIFMGIPQSDNNTLRDYEIAEGTERLELGWGCEEAPYISTLIIPSSVEEISGCLDFACDIVMHSPHFKCLNNCVVTADGKELVSYYGGKSELIIPEGVKVIKDHAFSFCKASAITFPNSVEEIEESAFCGCFNLEHIRIPNVKRIGDSVFTDCESLEVMEINEGIEEIGDSEFMGCDNLKDIRFVDAAGIESHSCRYRMVSSETQDPQNGEVYTNRFLCNSDGELMVCLTDNPVVNIPEGIRVIGENAFYNRQSLRSLHIPNDVISIRYSAFSYCSNLLQVHLPNRLKKLSSSVFEGCKNLSSIELPRALKVIEGNPWGFDKEEDRLPIEHLELPDGLLAIHSCAFSCTKIKELSIPSSVMFLSRTVYHDSMIEKVTVQNGDVLRIPQGLSLSNEYWNPIPRSPEAF